MKSLSLKLPKRFYVTLSSLAMFLFIVTMGCNQGPPKNSLIAQANDGKKLFDEQCSGCHGGEGVEVDKSLVDTLEALPPDLTRINQRRGVKTFPVAEIARFIDGRILVAAHGPREMPVWGQVYEDEGMVEGEIKGEKGKLIAYLMRIQDMD
jgi:mono/diheme cytochrome c family protein